MRVKNVKAGQDNELNIEGSALSTWESTALCLVIAEQRANHR
jgi:hypothetical protein